MQVQACVHACVRVCMRACVCMSNTNRYEIHITSAACSAVSTLVGLSAVCKSCSAATISFPLPQDGSDFALPWHGQFKVQSILILVIVCCPAIHRYCGAKSAVAAAVASTACSRCRPRCSTACCTGDSGTVAGLGRCWAARARVTVNTQKFSRKRRDGMHRCCWRLVLVVVVFRLPVDDLVYWAFA